MLLLSDVVHCFFGGLIHLDSVTLKVYKHLKLTGYCYLMLWKKGEHLGFCFSARIIFPGVISYTEYLFLLCILTSEYAFELR